MKKVKKSFKAILITLLVGTIVPNIFNISKNSIENKIVWKILLSLAFTISTIMVGKLFSLGIIKNRRTGGKTRICGYLLFALIFILGTPIMSTIFDTASKIGKIILGLISSIILTFALIKAIKIMKTKIKTKKPNTFLKLNNDVVVNKLNCNNKESHKTLNLNLNESNNKFSNILEEKAVEKVSKKLYTVEELWWQKNPSDKCITITNDDNPNLKWIKIYKPRYNDGNFYGYIKMDNARETINGIVYYADQSIWYYE